VISRGDAVSDDKISAARALLMADAPPASARDTPAAPITGKAIFRRFRFAVFFTCAMVESSYRQVSTSFVAPFGCIAQAEAPHSLNAAGEQAGPAGQRGDVHFRDRERFWLFLLGQKNTRDSRIRKTKSARQ
jgi:hypothetical protein